MTSFNQDDTFNEFDARYLLRDAFQDWTPTVDQNGAVAVTVDYAKYLVHARFVVLLADLTVTGSGSAGTRIEVRSLPFSLAYTAGRVARGDYLILDNNTAIVYAGVIDVRNPTTIAFRSDQAGFVGANPSFGLASGDTISFSMKYERT